jgi:outer membrane putative beta-barrel porin/alpha-amylase
MKSPAMAIVFAVATTSSACADEALRDLCPDRPGKGTSACTLDEGHFQLESDVFNGSFQRTGGVTTNIWFVTDPNLKYGIADNVDIEANLSPLVVVRTHNARTGATSVIGGIGDLFLRAKFALVGNSGSDFALALDPFLKIPTARIGIGNGAVEGGILVPISVSLGDGWSLGSTPELDVLRTPPTTAGMSR